MDSLCYKSLGANDGRIVIIKLTEKTLETEKRPQERQRKDERSLGDDRRHYSSLRRQHLTHAEQVVSTFKSSFQV